MNYDGQLSNVLMSAAAGQLSCSQNSENWFQKFGYGAPESVVGLHQILVGNVITCLDKFVKFWGCGYT